METKTQKQKLLALKNEITAIYFSGSKRIMTYGGVNYLDATLELIRLQERDKTAITMIVVDELPTLETSWKLEDYTKYIGGEQ